MVASRRRLILAMLVLLSGADTARGEPAREGGCGSPLLQVTYSAEADLMHACEAFRRVDTYLLERHGPRLLRPVRLVFADVVTVEFGGESFRVLGANNRAARLIQVTSFTSPWLQTRFFYGLQISPELHVNLLVHEFVHSILGDNYRINLRGFASDEYIAYAIQFATMDPIQRERILASNPAEAFPTTGHINDFYLMFNPEDFAIRAYLHFEREGAERMIDQVLSGAFLTFFP